MSAHHEARVAAMRAYMHALDAADYATITGLFAQGATVTSPFLGKMPAPDFFAKLGQASSDNTITPIDIFVSERGDDHAVAYFQYDWTMADGSVVVFKAMDLFGFEPDGSRFVSLDIVYDTHPVRAEHGDKYQKLAGAD